MFRTLVFTGAAMTAFAGNSLLCRVALRDTGIDAAQFTLIRILSGAVFLSALVLQKKNRFSGAVNWGSAAALFAYAAGFSFAYIKLSAGAGALLLFGAVQTTMIGFGLREGERLKPRQITGLLAAFAGIIALMVPGLSAPPLFESLLMIGAGVSWGVYSLRGKGAVDPIRTTAGNFLRASVFALSLIPFLHGTHSSWTGIGYAVASGAIASGCGYAVWYSVLPSLRSTDAAIVQLSVPVIAAAGGIVLLQEVMTMRLLVCSIAVLGGIILVMKEKQR